MRSDGVCVCVAMSVSSQWKASIVENVRRILDSTINSESVGRIELLMSHFVCIADNDRGWEEVYKRLQLE